jgi:hypoxia up-regulated 1
MGRPKAIEDFQQAMFAARHFFVEASKNNTEAIAAVEAATEDEPATPPKFTPEELEVVEKMLKEYEHWMDSGMSQQVVLDETKTSEPLVLVKDLESKGKLLQATVSRGVGTV